MLSRALTTCSGRLSPQHPDPLGEQLVLFADQDTPRTIAIIALVLGVLLLFMPFLTVRYETKLVVLTKDTLSGKKTYTITTYRKPDADFILLYTYGSLQESMPGYHALARSHKQTHAGVSRRGALG